MIVLAIALSAVSLQVLGAVWFMLVIPRLYAYALGRDDLADRKPGLLFILGPFVCGLAVTLTDAVLLRWFHLEEIGDALAFGLLTGGGYLVATVFNVAINPNIPRPLLYGVINAPFFLVSNTLACVMLAALS